MSVLVLASQSPRRRELLKLITEDFIICPDDSPENASLGLKPCEYVSVLSKEKCLNVSKKFSDDSIVIGADTVVVSKGEILGKPSNEDEAKNMLKMLSDDFHTVYTGVCIVRKSDNKCISFFEKTDVYFYKLSDDEISRYVQTKEPMDKAGAYGIQEKGALFVKKVEGDYNNVVGLPLARLARVLRDEFYLNI